MGKQQFIARKTSTNGIALLKKFEGCRLTCYDDATGKPLASASDSPIGIPTIGYGQTGPNIIPGLTIDSGTAETLLINAIIPLEASLNRLITVKVTQNQFDALISLAYNIGIGRLATSTVLSALNSSNPQLAADSFSKFNHSQGRILPGLTTRRLAEAQLFNTPDKV